MQGTTEKLCTSYLHSQLQLQSFGNKENLFESVSFKVGQKVRNIAGPRGALKAVSEDH